MPTIFKKCPSCGKRFEVKHTGESVEKKVDIVTEEKIVSAPTLMMASSLNPALNFHPPEPGTVKVAESIEDDKYTETYKCMHCGNVWTEKHEEVEDLGPVKGAEVER